jgi:quinol monooxygenase YgiN
MIVTAIFKAKPGKEVELHAELRAGAAESWKEGGVRGYYVHELIDQPGSYMNIEVYKDAAAFASHLETNHVKAFLGKLEELLAEPLTVYQGTALFGGENSKAAL